MGKLSLILCGILLFIVVEFAQAKQCPALRQTKIKKYACSNKRNENSRCFFRCSLGYALTKKSSQMRICRCRNNRCTWTGTTAFCMRKTQKRPVTTRRPVTTKPAVRKCSALPRPSNIRYRCTRSIFAGSSCTFSCVRGSLVNPSARTRVCRCRGSRCYWSGSVAICTVRRTQPTRAPTTRRPVTTRPVVQRCSSIPRSSSVRFTCSRGSLGGSACTFTCVRGSLVNPATRRRVCRCRGSSCLWSGSVPVCRVRPPTTTTRKPTTTTTTTTKATTTRATTTTTTYSMPDQSAINDCPVPDFGRHSYQVIDTWPTGAVIRIVINKEHLLADNGWTVQLTFTKELPDDVTVVSWTSELVSLGGRYLSVKNQPHNKDLTGIDVFSFTIVMIGGTLESTAGYTALVAFYPEEVTNAECFASANNGNPGMYLQQPGGEHGSNGYSNMDKKIEKRPSGILRPKPSKKPIQTTTIKPRVQRPTAPTIRRTTTHRPQQQQQQQQNNNNGRDNSNRDNNNRNNNQNTNNQNNNNHDNNNNNHNNQNNNNHGNNNNHNNQNNNNHGNNNNNHDNNNHGNNNNNHGNNNVQIDNGAVQRMKGSCNVLRNGMEVKNPGYESVSGSGKYRFNADLVISGEKNMMKDWTLKVVFSKPMDSIQVWEANLGGKSSDGHVFMFKPKTWNAELRDDFSFLIIPQMEGQEMPKTVIFLCPGGVTPNMDWRGLFGSPRQQQQGSGSIPQDQQEQEKLRQKELERRQKAIAREQRKQQEKRQRQIQLEQEEKERRGEVSSGQNNNNNNNNRPNNNNNNRPNNNNNNRPNNNNNNRPNNNNNNRPNNNNNNRPNNNNNNRPNNNNNNNNNNGRPASYQRPSRQGGCGAVMGRLPSNPGQTRVTYKKSPRNERRPYDYNQVIAMSILFYEAQRSGKLPRNNRIPWRGDSGLTDGCDVRKDLTGGWYDAGDHVKFGLPMAWSVTTLAWGVIEFERAYKDAGEYNNVLDSLKWVTDYFLKAHTAKYELYGQVGGGQADHSYWGRAEEMTMSRPSYKITKDNPGTELAAETAAAMAACSVVFKKTNPSYAARLVRHARELYEFADKYRRSYHTSIPDVTAYYRSYSGFNDELVWGALWLYRATGMQKYLTDAKNKYRTLGGGATPKMFSWDDKRAGSQVLLANFTGERQYINHVQAYQNFLKTAYKTPRGLVWLDQWGSNRYAANAAFIALAAAKVPSMPGKNNLVKFAQSQIHFMLGGSGRSYVIGYGRNPPKRPHHRGSSCGAPPSECSWGNAFHNSAPNPYVLYGALIAGPDRKGKYVDDRQDYIANEVATDYNAGFQSALAGLKYFQILKRRG